MAALTRTPNRGNRGAGKRGRGEGGREKGEGKRGRGEGDGEKESFLEGLRPELNP